MNPPKSPLTICREGLDQLIEMATVNATSKSVDASELDSDYNFSFTNNMNSNFQNHPPPHPVLSSNHFPSYPSSLDTVEPASSVASNFHPLDILVPLGVMKIFLSPTADVSVDHD